MDTNKKYELEITVHLLVEADEKGSAAATTDILLLKLSNNLINSTIVNIKEVNTKI